MAVSGCVLSVATGMQLGWQTVYSRPVLLPSHREQVSPHTVSWLPSQSLCVACNALTDASGQCLRALPLVLVRSYNQIGSELGRASCSMCGSTAPASCAVAAYLRLLQRYRTHTLSAMRSSPKLTARVKQDHSSYQAPALTKWGSQARSSHLSYRNAPLSHSFGALQTSHAFLCPLTRRRQMRRELRGALES